MRFNKLSYCLSAIVTKRPNANHAALRGDFELPFFMGELGLFASPFPFLKGVKKVIRALICLSKYKEQLKLGHLSSSNTQLFLF